ncbi:hypothetical protein ACHAXR_004150 [Thalassiosira sp. AJA248-18]
MDAKSYATSSSPKVLERAVKLKMDKYGKSCIEQHQSFAPLINSVDGMACKEGKAFEKRLVRLLTSKHAGSYSEMTDYFVCGCRWLYFFNTLMLPRARVGRSFQTEIDPIVQ